MSLRKNELPRAVEQTAKVRVRKPAIMSGLSSLIILVALVCASFAFSFGLGTKKTYAAPTDHLPVAGINYTNLEGFADAMKQSRAHWDTYGTLDGSAPSDANGWPTTDASIMVWEGRDNNQGTYTLTFNGQADVTVSLNYATINDKTYDAGSNTTTARLVVTDTGAENFQLNFANTIRTSGAATNTGVTNVRLMRPTSPGSSTSYDPSVIFTTELKDALSNYAYIRFMAGTNWNTSVNWSDRTRPTDASQKKVLPGESGFEGNLIAFEYEVDLCNETGKDCYINIPGRANDDYVTKLAQLIKYGSDGINPYTSPQSNPAFAPLRSDLKAYIEYSNEVWNFGFQQAHDVADAAAAEVNAGGSNLNYDGETNSIGLAMRYAARRTVQISQLFRNVFGDEMISRIRPVLEWQYNNLNGTAAAMLDFVNNYYNNVDGQHVSDPHPITYYIWGAGGAVYYGSNNDAATSVDAIYASGLPVSHYDGDHTYQQALNIEAAWAHAYGLHFVAYEGGFAVGGDGPSDVDTAARWDPRARQSMLDSFNVFAQAGGDLYTTGTYAQWKNLYEANNDPLVQAAHDINNGTFTPSSVTQGTQVSGSDTTTINGSSYDIRVDAYQSGAPLTDNVGRSAGYLLRVSNEGTYTVAVSVGNTSDGKKLAVFVDGNLLSAIDVPNTGSMSSYQTVTAGSVSLTAGLHAVLVVATQPSAGHVNSILIAPGGTVSNPTPTPTASTPTPTPSSDGWTKCADEGGVCTVNGTAQVRYGANGTYTTQTVTDSIFCSNDAFGGDPLPNVVKHCDYQ
ncbi:carbohydrate-binding protein [Tengunoibacter tsumagoiensis]|uniref:CBM6 domain-containing protein n=1 Tax=Tengunoibacter tsumagoiensis TaxID=2014871 RepID=A0A402A6I9_9CHLR|nr:carbohydrate-binding domain-containing protein [Tengunoibacter tsumagoiensis]GCE14763.1 hypothetical protein KTT_46220 [Tengunoibacter tsumagoiensis]